MNNERADIVCGCVSEVDNEVGMFWRNLCVADPVSFESRGFYQSSGVISGRPSKDAAATGKIERLTVCSFGESLPTDAFEALRVSCLQSTGNRKNYRGLFLKDACPVSKSALGSGIGANGRG